jgi:hypothetical protein
MTKVLSRPELLKLANERIRARPGFVEGMQIVEAEMTGPILVMRGECFFDEAGNATDRTEPAIKFYNDFAHEFASDYSLAA